jgi:predicted SprT family Zn-dependent metalloprotease
VIVNLAQIKDVCDETFDFLGFPQLKDAVQLKFNRRFTRVLGQAKRSHGNFTIEFSSKLWQFTPDTKKVDTIKHECCHSVSQFQYLYADIGHGPYWQGLMQKLGLEPKPCFSMSELQEGAKQFRRRNARKFYKFRCNCPSGHIVVNSRTFNKIKTNSGRHIFSCPDCNSVLTTQLLCGMIVHNWNGQKWDRIEV